MKIGLVQYNPAWEDKTTNQVRLQELLNERSPDVSLLIFTEMAGVTMEPGELILIARNLMELSLAVMEVIVEYGMRN